MRADIRYEQLDEGLVVLIENPNPLTLNPKPFEKGALPTPGSAYCFRGDVIR